MNNHCLKCPHLADDALVLYEKRATEFYRKTGLMAPGKDQPAAMGGYPNYEQRVAAFEEWAKENPLCPGIAPAPLAPVAGLDYITGAVEDFTAGRISAGKFGELLGARDLHTFKNRCVVDGGDDGPKHCACEFPADYNDPRIEPLKECTYHAAMRTKVMAGGKVVAEIRKEGV